MKTQVDAAFWSCTEDAELLTHTEVDEAVEAFLDRAPKLWPAQLVVYGFVRQKVLKP